MPLLNGTVQAVYSGATRVARVYYGAKMVWPSTSGIIYIRGTNDLKGDLYLSWMDVIRYQVTDGQPNDLVYFSQNGQFMLYQPGPGWRDVKHYTGHRSVEFLMVPSHGHSDGDETFEIRKYTGPGTLAHAHPATDPIIATVHLIAMPPVALIPGGEVQAVQQQQVIFTATAGTHTDDILYFTDETLLLPLPADHVNLGGLPVAGTTPQTYIRYPAPGPHIFKFWTTGSVTRIALRLGKTTPKPATDAVLARVVVT